jgi:hypothetical protein
MACHCVLQSKLGARVLLRKFCSTFARAADQITTRLRTHRVRVTPELTHARMDAQRSAMTVDHAHVRAMSVESSKLVGAFSEAREVVTRNSHVLFESRKAAGPTGDAFWNLLHGSDYTRWDVDSAECLRWNSAQHLWPVLVSVPKGPKPRKPVLLK